MSPDQCFVFPARARVATIGHCPAVSFLIMMALMSLGSTRPLDAFMTCLRMEQGQSAASDGARTHARTPGAQ